MRTSEALLAKHFGDLATVRGILTYKLSPFEQRAFAGAISHGLPNIFRRIRSKIFIVAPPFIVGYLVYTENEKEHQRLMRKNPDDFKDDK
uniref:Cytochrome b-c1 complex subunit 8 n=1 Tax=Graphocephala atropunctata TaxID=36148 RepID=Q1W286_9HEMI|nr:putative ubiquinol-cytochrome c reductase complex ubiquinone-binding protein QP-C [Graphocephala atropunctata]